MLHTSFTLTSFSPRRQQLTVILAVRKIYLLGTIWGIAVFSVSVAKLSGSRTIQVATSQTRVHTMQSLSRGKETQRSLRTFKLHYRPSFSCSTPFSAVWAVHLLSNLTDRRGGQGSLKAGKVDSRLSRNAALLAPVSLRGASPPFTPPTQHL